MTNRLQTNVPSAPTTSGAIDQISGAYGEALTAEFHGRRYTQANRGSLFIGHSVSSTIPVNASGLVSTFALVNPAGSLYDLEVLSLSAGKVSSATAVIGSLIIVEQHGTAYTALATTTAATVTAGKLGAANPNGLLYNPGTHTGTPTPALSLGHGWGTTTEAAGPTRIVFDIDGALILPPGSVISITSTAAQTQPHTLSIIWNEIKRAS